MNRIIAAVDNSPAARPVLRTAVLLAPMFRASPEAVHVREDGDPVARSAAQAEGVQLRIMEGDVATTLEGVAQAEDVVAMVMGARGSPWGKRPAGHTALRVMTHVEKPLVVVPPQTSLSLEPHRLLAPLEGAAGTAAAVAETVRMACLCGMEVVAAHVFDERSVPLFEDHAGHEKAAWRNEFLARNCPEAEATLELRTGVPGEQIVAAIGATGADLVVLGWGRDLSSGRAGVVRDVLERSDVPVVLVPTTHRSATPVPERSAARGRAT